MSKAASEEEVELFVGVLMALGQALSQRSIPGADARKGLAILRH